MSEHAPTTEDVRNGFANNEFIKSGHDVAYLMEFAGEYQAQFDRWLAQHDAEVAKVERVWILALLEGKQDWAVSDVLALIKGENE